MTKTSKRYEIRTVRKGNVFTSPTNYRLYDRCRAVKIVKRLRKSGVDAVASFMTVAA